jgi:hypothetical protein
MVMKAKGIKAMMTALKAKGVHVCGTTDEFYGCKNDNNGIWVAAEYTPSLFGYYSEVWGDTFGVDPKLNKMVEDSGWYFEWHDAGTMMVWES